MYFLLTQRRMRYGEQSFITNWTASGPFNARGRAERAAIAALAVRGCLSARVLTSVELTLLANPKAQDPCDRQLWLLCQEVERIHLKTITTE